jgi:hypothetical protein
MIIILSSSDTASLSCHDLLHYSGYSVIVRGTGSLY